MIINERLLSVFISPKGATLTLSFFLRKEVHGKETL